MVPAVWLKASQIDSPRPPSRTAPSIWYAAVAAPHTQFSGKTAAVDDITEVSQSDVAAEADQRAIVRAKGPATQLDRQALLLPHECCQLAASSFRICSIVSW